LPSKPEVMGWGRWKRLLVMLGRASSHNFSCASIEYVSSLI